MGHKKTMSSKKEERKDDTSSNPRIVKVGTEEREEAHVQYQHSVNRALDETRDNIRKATDEARKEVPRYTQAVNDYQEQTIQASREIADTYVESQKEIINSIQSAWIPYVENVYGVFWNYWISPRRLTEVYARAVSSVADNTIAVTRLANNTVFANMEAFRTSVQHAKDNAKELSRIGVNAAKTFEQTSRDTTREFSSTTEKQQR
jgi:hypothetical protein